MIVQQMQAAGALGLAVTQTKNLVEVATNPSAEPAANAQKALGEPLVSTALSQSVDRMLADVSIAGLKSPKIL